MNKKELEEFIIQVIEKHDKKSKEKFDKLWNKTEEFWQSLAKIEREFKDLRVKWWEKFL